MSLAIANQMLGYAFAPEYKEQANNYMTMEWWASLTPEGETIDHEWRIGASSVRSR